MSMSRGVLDGVGEVDHLGRTGGFGDPELEFVILAHESIFRVVGVHKPRHEVMDFRLEEARVILEGEALKSWAIFIV